ncbi:MAG: hypothetical protein PVJ76_21220 [Gemmatimonadota bacterium]|jgi:hypothetical protein
MRSLSILLVSILILPGFLWAQEEPGAPPQNRVGGVASVTLKAGETAGVNRLSFGGWAGLTFSGNVALGGGGFALSKDVELTGSEGETGFNLSMGYGGLTFRFWEPLANDLYGEVGVLLGAGHAVVEAQLTGTEVGSDNFLVGEGELGVSYRLLRRIFLGAAVGYRLTSGVQGLPEVSTDDLNAFTGSLFLRVGGN